MFELIPELTPKLIARLDHLRMRTKREFAGMGRGSHLSPRRGSSLEFSDFRPYALGDDFRHIDWGLYARTDKFYIKLFKEEEDLLTYIFLDDSASMAYPAADNKFRAAVAIALALAYVALSEGDRVMLRMLSGRPLPTGAAFVQGRNRIAELARVVVQFKPAGALDLAAALARELISIKRAGKVFVISDFLMLFNSIRRGLGLFAAANMDVSAIQVLGAGELNGQGVNGSAELVDAETGERLRLAVSEKERARYRETLLRLAREIRAVCLKQGMRYALYNTGQSFEEFFLKAATQLDLVS
jgi:uncharacterized protein (DUF58 family)